MAAFDLEYPKRWGGLSSTELLWTINEPEEQELLMRYLMGKFMWKQVLFTTVEQESKIEEIKTLRLSILAILCDDDDCLIDMSSLRPKGAPIKKTHPRKPYIVKKTWR